MFVFYIIECYEMRLRHYGSMFVRYLSCTKLASQKRFGY